FDAGPGHGDGVGRLAEHGDAGLLPEDPELLDGGRALEVGPDQEGVAPLLLPPEGQLGRRRRLTRTLESGQQDHGRWPRGVRDLEALAAEHADQFLVDSLDHLLARSEAGRQRLRAHPEPDPFAEAPRHRELYVGLEERDADLAERLIEVGLADAALTPQARRNALQTVREGVEHTYSG